MELPFQELPETIVLSSEHLRPRLGISGLILLLRYLNTVSGQRTSVLWSPGGATWKERVQLPSAVSFLYVSLSAHRHLH